MVRHRHHFKIAFMLAIAAGSWGVYWLPQRYLENGGLTGAVSYTHLRAHET